MSDSSQNYSSTPRDETLGIGLVYGGVTLVLVLAAFFALNYFNVVSLSEVFPSAFGWLPHVQSGKAVVPSKLGSAPSATNTAKGVFEPSTNPQSQEGPLVKRYLVVYTLEGKITKIESTSGGKYKLDVSALNGGQTFTVDEIGGSDILKGNQGPVDWPDLKPGTDVIVDVTVSSVKSGQPQVTVSQITLTGRQR